MSIWNDIRRRGIGVDVKQEDKVEAENSWEVTSKWRLGIVGDEIQRLKKEQVKLNKNLSDLRRELDKFQWDKSKNYVKHNYKI